MFLAGFVLGGVFWVALCVLWKDQRFAEMKQLLASWRRSAGALTFEELVALARRGQEWDREAHLAFGINHPCFLGEQAKVLREELHAAREEVKRFKLDESRPSWSVTDSDSRWRLRVVVTRPDGHQVRQDRYVTQRQVVASILEPKKTLFEESAAIMENAIHLAIVCAGPA